MGSVLRAAANISHPFGAWLESAYALIPFTWRYGKLFRQTYAFLEKSQWWSLEKLREYQRQQLSKLLSHAYENVPYYRRIFDERGLKPKDIEDVSDLAKLPILTRDIIREHRDELIAENISRDDIVEFSTSGSTGAPLSFIAKKALYKIEAAFITRAFSAHNSRLYREKSIWLRRYVPQGNAPIYKYDRELKRMYLSAYHLSLGRIKEYVELMNSYGARLLVGYPSSIYILAVLLEESGLKLDNIWVVHVASEKLLNQWKTKIEKVLGVPVKDHYGMVERVSLFHRCDNSELYHENPEYGVTEIINQADGVGEVVGTGFHNYLMPFIRYKMNDVARVNNNGQMCSCGRGLPLTVQEFEGRTDDILVTPEGRYIPGVNFYTMMYRIKGIKMFKIIQHTTNDVEVQIVTDNEFLDSSQEMLRNGMFDRMGRINLDINIVEEIPRSRQTGKIRCIENRAKSILKEEAVQVN